MRLHMTKRFLTLAATAATAMASLGLSAMPVSAATPSDIIVLRGSTTALNCLTNCGGAANLPLVNSLAATGTYSFSSSRCEYVSVPDDTDTNARTGEAGTCDPFTSTGTYTQPVGRAGTGVCGTGTADGSATVTSASEGSVTVNYHIAFTGGLGTISDNGGSTESDVDGSNAIASITGPVAITASGAPDRATNNCTPGFDVAAVVTASE